MHIAIIFLGLLLALGGGASVFASLSAATPGRDIALALGGATAIVGGCVIVAIGLALLRLQKLLRDRADADAAAAARLRQTLEAALRQRDAAEEPIPAFLAPAAPLPPPPDFLRRAAPRPAATEPRGAQSDTLVMSILEETGVAEAPPPPIFLEPKVTEVGPPPKPSPVPPSAPAAPLPPPVIVIDEAFAAPKPPPQAAPHLDIDRPHAAAAAPVVTLPLPPAPAAPMRVSPAPQIFAPQPEPAAFRVPEIVLPPVFPPSLPSVAVSPPAPPPPPKPAAFEPPPHVPAPTEVGRYNAGGATYVMYSDGSIEAETETGAYRFASMAELRDHIEQRGMPSGGA